MESSSITAGDTVLVEMGDEHKEVTVVEVSEDVASEHTIAALGNTTVSMYNGCDPDEAVFICTFREGGTEYSFPESRIIGVVGAE